MVSIRGCSDGGKSLAGVVPYKVCVLLVITIIAKHGLQNTVSSVVSTLELEKLHLLF